MDSKITIYQSATGRILRTVECPTELVAMQIGIDEDYIDGLYDSDEWYIVGTTPTVRPTFTPLTTISITANGVDSAYMGDVPGGSILAITTPPSADNIFNDNVTSNISLSSIIEGNHDYAIENWPYKEYTTTIFVVPLGASGLDDQWFEQIAPPIGQSFLQSIDVGTFTMVGTSVSSGNNATIHSTGTLHQLESTLNSSSNYNSLFTSVAFTSTSSIDSVSNLEQLLNSTVLKLNAPDVGSINSGQLFNFNLSSILNGSAESYASGTSHQNIPFAQSTPEIQSLQNGNELFFTGIFTQQSIEV